MNQGDLMKHIILTAMLLLFAMTAAFIVPASASSLFDHQVVIIGETHRRADSTEWFLTTVSNYLKNGKCLHVALEIKSSQQPVLNAAMRGSAPFSSIHCVFRSNATGDSDGTRHLIPVNATPPLQGFKCS
jgi:hypothetical protein